MTDPLIPASAPAPIPEDFALDSGGTRLVCHWWTPLGGAARSRKRMPIVLVHGGGVDSSFFSGTGLAQNVATDRPVLAYDRRGCGASDDAPDEGDWSAAVHVRDLTAVCERAGGGAPVIVLGHSLGGGIALRLATARPDLVGALVVVEPFGVGDADAADRARHAEAARLASEGHLAQAVLVAALAQGSSDPPAPRAPPSELAHIDRNLRTMIVHDLVAGDASLDRDRARRSLAHTPTWVCLGDLSADQAAGRVCPDLARDLGCPLVRIPGSHNAPRDHPEEFAAVAGDLLAVLR